MKKLLNIFLILVTIFQLSYGYAAGAQMERQCRAADAGAATGGLLGSTLGAYSGVAIGTKISATGCALTGWWTFGVGCVASVAVGAITGAIVVAKLGEKAGEATCEI